MFETQVFPDSTEAVNACAGYLLERLEEVLSERRRATLALSGGEIAAPLFDHLAARRFAWERVHFFWVDERAVPPSDPASNYKLALEHLLLPAAVPAANIHRIHAELSPQAAARRYVDEIREFFGLAGEEVPVFDVVHRGMGSNAHTASLFPGEPLIEAEAGIAAALFVKEINSWRLSLLPPPLLAARSTAMLVTGASKAPAVREVFHEPYDPVRFPSQLGRNGRHHGCVWFLDQAAAEQL